MIIRVTPSKSQIFEYYNYSHLIEDRQRIDFKNANSKVVFAYDYNGDEFPDIKNLIERTEDEETENFSVGFLSLHNYRDKIGNLNKNKAIPIQIPVEGLTKKLTRLDQCEKSYEFELSELKWMPLRVEAKIIDESPSMAESIEYFEAHEFREHLNLNLTFYVNIPSELLQSSFIMQRKLSQILVGEIPVNLIKLHHADEINQDKIAQSIAGLANENGGIITFGINSKNKIIGVEESKIDELTNLFEISALSLDPPVPIQYYQFTTQENKTVLLIEVPKELPHLCKYKERYYTLVFGNNSEEDDEAVISSNKPKPYKYNEQLIDMPLVLSEAEVALMIKKGFDKSVYLVNRDLEELPKIQAAMANSGGGQIFFGIKSNTSGQSSEILGFSNEELDKFKANIKSSGHKKILTSRLYEQQIENKTILIQYIPKRLPDIIRHDDKFSRYNGKIIYDINNKEALELIREKRQQDFETIFPISKPIIRQLKLDWIPFPTNREYNPESNCLEWKNLPMNEESGKIGHFNSSLNISLSKAKELFERKIITGKVEIEIENLLFSDTSLEYYNGLGFQELIELDGIVKLESDLNLSLPDILKRRPYFPWRSISIVGVEPTMARVRDIIRALNDAGIITQRPIINGYSRVLEEGIEVRGKKQDASGITDLLCIIKGKQNQFKRQLQTGHRIDNKELVSGIVEIEFLASTEDTHIGIMQLLNEVTENIKQRFNYLRIE